MNPGSIRLGLLLLVGAPTAGVSAQPPADSRINPTPGAVERRVDRSDAVTAGRVMSTYGRCVARNRPRLAQEVLAMPLRSDEQHAAVRQAIGGIDVCMGASGAMLSFSPPVLVGAMAEFFLASRLDARNVAALRGLTDQQITARGLSPRTAHEDIAICLATREPEAALSLARAEPGSRDEGVAFSIIIPSLGPCSPAGQTHTFNHASVRSLVAVGLYRLLTATEAAR